MSNTTYSNLNLPLEPQIQQLYELFQYILKTRSDRPVFKNFNQNDIEKYLNDSITSEGKGVEYLIEVLENIVIKHSMNLQNPMYMGHQVPPTLPLASMLDLITSSMNQSLAVCKMSPVLSIIEKELIAFLCKQIGYNDKSAGTITSGGSISNLLGLYGARKKYFPEGIVDNAVIICSEQSHYSVSKAANIMGLNSKNVVKVPTHNDYRIDIQKTIEIIKNLIVDNKLPFAISANAGSTSTGSFDYIEGLAKVAQQFNLWLHIDGAHGASLVFSDELKQLLVGIEKADSISWDAHKMMFIPSGAGICLFKDGQNLINCFKDDNAPYLYNSKDQSLDLSKLSIQCTRRGDVLKIWGCLLAYGTDFFAKRLEHLADVTGYFYDRVNDHLLLESLHKPQFNIFCFRYNPSNKEYSEDQLNDINAQIRDAVNDTGETMITMTSINGNVSLRTTIINPATTYRHIDRLIELIEECAP